MSLNKQVLCEIAFWVKFSECYPSFMPIDEGERNRMKSWIAIYDFITHSNMSFDCSGGHFYELAKNDPYLLSIWKQSTDGCIELEFDGHFRDTAQALSHKPFSLLFTQNGKGPQSKKYGVINLNSGNCLTKYDLFRINGVAMRRGEPWDWNSIRKIIPENASNSMVIVDNYVLKNAVFDLPHIINLLLPEECAIGYHLTIIYYSGNGAKIGRDDIMNILKEKKPNLVDNIELEIVSTVDPTDFHDRTIITNNIYISSKGGFDISRWDRETRTNVARRSTSIEVAYPDFVKADHIVQEYVNLIMDAKEALSHSCITSHNRLLSDDYLSSITSR